MSGYLQRLTQSAIQPSQRVHPMVGSMFAPAGPEVFTHGGAPFESSETVISKRTDSRRSQDPGDDAPSPDKEEQEVQRQPYIEEKPFELLLPEAREVEASLTPAERLDPESLRESTRELEDRPPFAPLMPASEQHAVSLAKPPATAAQRVAANALTKLDTHREPDEIRIHIGRVEVLAIPQVQAPVISKAVRTAPSLDDYLRRRDRRSS